MRAPPPMAADCFTRLQDAMDGLWFQQNILFFEPAGVTFRSLAEMAKPIASASSSQSPRCSTSVSIERRGCGSPEIRKQEPERLNIVVGEPLFQLRPPPRRKATRWCRTLSELENYELKGFKDLGFTFPREKLSPQLVSTVPALHRLMAKGEEEEGEKKKKGDGDIKRPYLSEAWLIRSSPQLDLQTLPSSSTRGVDMKRSLRFWARGVAASMLHHESRSSQFEGLSSLRAELHACVKDEKTVESSSSNVAVSS